MAGGEFAVASFLPKAYSGSSAVDRVSLFLLSTPTVCVWSGEWTSGLDSANKGFAEWRSQGVPHN